MRWSRKTEVPHIPDNAVGVDLENNNISALKENKFSHLGHCRKLDLNRNQISKIELGAFRGLNALIVLNLRRNKLTSLEPGTFSGMAELRVLELGRNKLNSLNSEMFGGLVYLEKLGLNGNGIRDLPSDVFNSYFNNLISLRNLELHRNNIRRIYPGNFAYLPKLRRLILNKNKLTTLNQNIFVSSDDDQFDLRHLYLENNPIHCDQKLCWLKQKVFGDNQGGLCELS